MNIQKGYAIAAVLIVGALILVPSAIAQSERLTVSIPFDFYVATKLFPAGTYTIAPRPHGAAAIQIFSQSGESAYVLTTGLKDNPRPNESRLTFKQYGDARFLSGIYWAGYRQGRETQTSALEQRLARNAAPATLAVAGK